MLSRQELAEVLRLDKLELPQRPRVVDVKYEEYEDSTGDDSLQVYAILDDATPEEEWTWVQVEPIYDAIRSALRAAGEDRWAYFTVGTRQQYEQRYSYDPATDE